ncbi:MAG: Gfo/Idh/MocA family oxidoreductase [Defluviitaleaceae bacterium]|nr:Gfo/Idh/MocA family oxidoreductase [Defluviitaleaceae bacterium]
MIHVAIVGCGNISSAHLKSYMLFPNRCKIVALVDIIPAKAQAKKDQLNLAEATVFDSVTDLLNSGIKVDLVSNCTPPFEHAPIAIACMNAGINVLGEKPMATCLAECDAIIAAEERNGVFFAAGAQNRYLDFISRLKKLADSQIAGRVRCAHVESLWWRGHCYYDLWWRGTWQKEGGGPMLNHAVHQIDMINWIQGELPAEVTAVLSNVAHDNSEVEDLGFAICKYTDGALANIVGSVVHHGGTQRIVLQCEDAKIAAPFSVAAEVSKPNGFGDPNTALEQKITDAYNALPSLAHQGFDGQIDDVLAAIEQGRRPSITSADGRKTVELITAIYKSGCTQQTVTLPLSKEDEWYTFEGIMKNAHRFHEKKTAAKELGDDQITLGNYLK